MRAFSSPLEGHRRVAALSGNTLLRVANDIVINITKSDSTVDVSFSVAPSP